MDVCNTLLSKHCANSANLLNFISRILRRRCYRCSSNQKTLSRPRHYSSIDKPTVLPTPHQQFGSIGHVDVTSNAGDESSRESSREIRLIDTMEAADESVSDLLSQAVIAFDSEGVQLGRSGLLCLTQIATSDRIYLFDCLDDRVVQSLKFVLEDATVMKVAHDIRNESTHFYHQFNIQCNNVYDTQVASMLLDAMNGNKGKEVSLKELLLNQLEIEFYDKHEVKSLMYQNPLLWTKRPFGRNVIKYAVQDVVHLHALENKLSFLLGENARMKVIEKSKAYVNYRHLNENIQIKTLYEVGASIEAMVGGTSKGSRFLRLNLPNSDVVATSPTHEFHEYEVGDVVQCSVTGWTSDLKRVFMKPSNPKVKDCKLLRNLS